MESRELSTLTPVSPATRRYIGVEVRPRSFGWLAVENDTVLDCGVRECELPESHGCLRQRFARILDTFLPSVVIMRCSTSPSSNANKRAVVRGIRRGAKERGLPVVVVRPASIRRYFSRYNAATKYDIAQMVAQTLPELRWELPPKRRAWNPEDRRMRIFDAAAALIIHAMLE